MSSALALSAFTAATAFISIALASAAVPLVCCAKAVGEDIRTAADTAAIIDVRSMAFLLFFYIAIREIPVNSAKAYFPGPPVIARFAAPTQLAWQRRERNPSPARWP